MKKYIIFFVMIAFFVATSCTKEYEDRTVTYLVKGLAKPYKISYVDETGSTISNTINPAGINDVWSYKFTGKQGDIVYLYAEFNDIGVDKSKFYFRILVDGKIYQNAYGFDKQVNDSTFWVQRAGIIPF